MRHQSARAELPKAFRANWGDDAQLERLLRRFEATGDQRDRDALLNHFLPLVAILANSEAYKNAGNDDLGDFISDGCVHLIPALPRLAQLDARSASAFATRIICQGFWKGKRERLWSGGDSRERENIIRRFRAAFVREHGQMPTSEQVSTHLSQLITNFGMETLRRRRMLSFSQLANEENDRVVEFSDPYRPIDSHAIKHAMRLFHGAERKAFRMAIAGATLDEIRVVLNLRSCGVASTRVNGLFWRARCNLRLASMLGVVADAEPVRNKNGQVRSIQAVPPARLAAG